MESMDKQMELEFAKSAVRSFDAEIALQQGRAGKLIADDNYLSTLEAEKERLEKEYLRATEEYDKAKLFAEGTENPLSVSEPAELPDEPEPSHRAVFSAFAGVASGTLASIVFFLLAFVDSSLQSPTQFQRVTRLPLIGYVNKVKVRSLNLQNLFSYTQKESELEVFKENIRKLRTALESSKAKNFLFVSPKEQEGKSFLIVMLAYALSLNNKRILIIDTNFKNNTLSDFKTKSFIEITTDPGPGTLRGLSTGMKELPPPSGAEYADPQLKNIDIVGNKGGSQSPSEVLAGKDFKSVLENYGKKYDFIFLEAAAMNKFSDARELIPYAEKIIAVFSTQVPIASADKDTIDFLRNMNGKMLGGILNNVDLKNL
jgi:Mrp family chromosome partitioning ATPase